MMAQSTNLSSESSRLIGQLVKNAKQAMRDFRHANQEGVDEAVTAIAWSLYEDGNAATLAELAVADTKLGNVSDKIIKNKRKTFGTLRDLMRVKTVGVIEENPKLGLVKYAKPVGVVGAVTPSTNPAATPVNKCMMAVKGRNAIIVAPSPSGWKTTNRAVELMRAQLDLIKAPIDLVQILPEPVNREITEELMRQVDLVVVTGSQSNVRGAYRSGTPAIGVGAGNVPVIVDETADLDQAASKICSSKIFDNGTSCSSENSVIVVDEIYDSMMQAFAKHGGYIATEEEKNSITEALWSSNGKLNRDLIAKDASVIARECKLSPSAESAKFIVVAETGVGSAYPLSGEKLSIVLTAYRVKSFEQASEIVQEILNFQGAGHSCGIHTSKPERAEYLAEELDVVRVLVNQAHTFGNGGGFTSGLNFTLSMGCGTWAGNSISENLNYRHFINITHLSTEIAEDRPSEDELFGAFLRKYHPDLSN